MMGEVSLETSPKNIMIQDMINSENSTNIFPGGNNQFYPDDILHAISPIVESFNKKNYMESAELQAMHNSKNTLMGRHNLSSEVKAQEIGKAQDRHLLFRNRLKSNQSVKSKGILEPKNIFSTESTIFVRDNIERHDPSFDVEQSSELPPGIPEKELSATEDELPYKEEQAQPTLPPMLPAASVIETPQIVP